MFMFFYSLLSNLNLGSSVVILFVNGSLFIILFLLFISFLCLGFLSFANLFYIFIFGFSFVLCFFFLLLAISIFCDIGNFICTFYSSSPSACISFFIGGVENISTWLRPLITSIRPLLTFSCLTLCVFLLGCLSLCVDEYVFFVLGLLLPVEVVTLFVQLVIVFEMVLITVTFSPDFGNSFLNSRKYF